MSTHGPISNEQKAFMNVIARDLDDLFQEQLGRKIAFVLLTAEFGDIEDGRVNYISNGERSDILAMLREFLSRAEGTHPEEKKQ